MGDGGWGRRKGRVPVENLKKGISDPRKAKCFSTLYCIKCFCRLEIYSNVLTNI